MIEYRIDKRIGLVVVRLSGDVTLDDLIRWYEEIERDRDFSSNLNGVSDMRQANVQLTRGDMARISEQIANRGITFGRWAVLVEDAKVTALSMIYGRQTDGVHETEIFSSEEAASEYLGVELQPLLNDFRETGR